MTNTEIDVHFPEVVEGVVVTELADDAVLTYVRAHEAWYAKANGIREPELYVTAQRPKGGCTWEFIVKEHNFDGKKAVKLEIFDDAFVAFAEIPDFFRTLREDEPVTVAEVAEILDSMGALDKTERESPYPKLATDPRLQDAVALVRDYGYQVFDADGAEVSF